MSQIDLPEVKVILDRVAKAMELRNSVDPQAIALSFITQNATFGLPAPRIEQKGSLGAARAAWDARAAWAAWAAWDAAWVTCVLPGAVELKNATLYQQFLPILEAVEHGLWMYYQTDTDVVWLPQPTIRKNARRQLHCENAPAFELPDEVLYFWNGILVPEQVVMNPEGITAKIITEESNAEVRRVMVERFGAERYIRELGAKELNRDQYEDILYRINLNGEPLLVLRVLNPTPLPDGTRKEYFLWCDAELRPIKNGRAIGSPQSLTAWNAVAASWGKYGTDFCPEMRA